MSDDIKKSSLRTWKRKEKDSALRNYAFLTFH